MIMTIKSPLTKILMDEQKSNLKSKSPFHSSSGKKF